MVVRAAVVLQAASIGFDREGTLSRLEALVAEAGAGGAQLAVFPEAFISAYPKGTDFGTVVGQRTREGREEFRRYFDSAVPTCQVRMFSASAPAAAQEHDIHLVVGVIERDGGTLYCTALFFAPKRGTWASTAS